MARKATKTKADTADAEAPKVTRRAPPHKPDLPAKAASASKRARASTSEATSAPRARAKTPRKTKAAAPLAAVAALTAPVARGSSKARKALKTAKDQALDLVASAPGLPTPSLPSPVADTVKAIGGQIVGALSSDVGRVMVAELLVYVAKSLTSAAAKTETAQDAKSAILNAGAKLGAVAADAGAKLVDTGHEAASGGAKLLEGGKDAVGSGMSSASQGASNASDIMREVAQVAVGAVGGVMADTASKFLKRRGKKADAPEDEAAEMAKAPGPGNVL